MRRPLGTFVSAMSAVALVAGCAGTTGEQLDGLGASASTEADPSSSSVSTTATTDPPDCAQMLPPAGQAAQLLMMTTNDPLNAAEVVANGTVGGFALVEGQRTDVGSRIATAVADAPLPTTVAVDEEGGSVQRLKNALGRIPSAETMGEATPEEAAQVFSEHAAAMAALGVTMNFAPVADVGDAPGLEGRVYGDDPATVGQFVTQVIDAQRGAGIVPVVKHWPGLGSGDDDPHESISVVAPIDELRAADLLPFERAIEAGVPAVMVTHAEIPGLTAPDEPASLSANAIGMELRQREGFDGVVITDDLGMDAIELPQAEAALQAVTAGADIALVSGSAAAVEAHARLTAAIEDETLAAPKVEAAVRRVLELKGVDGECFDAVSAYAEAARLENEALTAEAEAEADVEAGTGGGGTATTVASRSTSTTARATSSTARTSADEARN
jgi:beta-N-acetylhexosaminidase